jgi:predicted alpha/beta-hydrolase family hydrolase
MLQEAFREQVRLEKAERPERPLILAGKSMGGRVASLLVDELAAAEGVRGFLYLQGERDSFGRREDVESYELSPQVQLGWIPAGDHSFRPTRSSGVSEEQNLASTVAWSDEFLRQLLRR